MDEIAILASVASALLAFPFGVVVGRGTLQEPASPYYSDGKGGLIERSTVTVVSSHMHEATTMNAGGWFCDCGKHLHSFSQEGRCICGAEGTGKVWA